MAGSKYSGYSTDQLLQILLAQLGVTPTSGYSTDQLLQQLLSILLTGGGGSGGSITIAQLTALLATLPDSNPGAPSGQLYWSGNFLAKS